MVKVNVRKEKYIILTNKTLYGLQKLGVQKKLLAYIYVVYAICRTLPDYP